MRLVVLTYVFGHSDNEEIADELWDDKFTLITMIGDIICIFPFLLRAGYIEPKRIHLDQGSRVFLRIIELLSISRILRSTKDIPAVKAIRITLSRAVYHLVLPIFFFFAFNVFAAVIAYFIEPCYNTDICPWLDLFDASFYSVVTMTTTGYGDQVPYYFTTRMLALVIMIFGALFISLPLAIIGNEYDEAWTEVNEKSSEPVEELDTDAKANPEGKDEYTRGRISSRSTLMGRKSAEPAATTDPRAIDTIKEEAEENSKSDDDSGMSPGMPNVNFNVRMTPMTDDSDEEEEGSMLSNYSRIVALSETVKVEFETNGIGPVVLLSLCELRGWLASIRWQVSQSLKVAVTVKKHVSGLVVPASVQSSILNKKGDGQKRRFSILGAGKKNLMQVQPIEIGTNSSSSKSSLEVSERALLTRGDSLFDQGSRLRTISDISDSDFGTNNDMDNLEKGEGSVNQGVRPANLTSGASDRADDGRRRHSRRTFRGIATIFRQQLEQVSDEQAGDTINSGRRLPARSLLIMLAKASKDVIPGGSHSADFTKKMVRAARNPNSYRTRLWMLLELPSSSREARGLRYVLMFLILLSVFTLYTQTLTSLSVYGEQTSICGKVLDFYCSDKDDPSKDPGCFNNNVDFIQKLKFTGCDKGGDLNCFGYGNNFGAQHTNYTCQAFPGAIPPFRTQDELIQTYGKPNIANRREDSHRIYAPCKRVECSSTLGLHPGQNDGNVLWIPLEIVINIVFSIEILLRIFVAESFKDFFFDFLNLFDMFSILPFFAEVSSGGARGIDFAVLASSPEPLILVAMKSLKVFRLFKITRHFKATQVLIETALKVWKQLIGMLSLLIFIITVFAILLFEVEQGEGCYVGDSNCKVPDSVASIVSHGQYIYINKQGELSQFPNALYGLWFSIVTMTSTGYGDIVPSTNAGLVMAVFLMLFGSMYMAMPLTAAASVFYVIHESYNENKQRRKNNGKDPPKKKSSADLIHKAGSGDSPQKKASLSRIIGGGHGRSSVTPDPEAAEKGGRFTGVVEMASKAAKDKELNERAELTAKFDAHLQFKMERLMSRATELTTKIEHFLKDLQCTDAAGPVIPILDQAADIVESVAACAAAVDKQDLDVLHKLTAEFYNLSLTASNVNK